MKLKIGTEVPWQVVAVVVVALHSFFLACCDGQATNDFDTPPAPPPALDSCNGVFLTYTFSSREKEYPHVRNASAQAWAFKSIATITNAGEEVVEGWQMYVGFEHREILVSVTGAIVVGGDDFPVEVGNGTTFAGSPNADLKTSIETAGDSTQISAQIEIIGTQFGVKPPRIPMPKEIKLVNPASYMCPKATKPGKSGLQVCCTKDPKKKKKPTKKAGKLQPRRYGDLSISYDVLQAYDNNYLAQVTIENNNPLGRLDHWNLTWEWTNDEFIYSMKGAYPRIRRIADCIYGPAGKYYKDMDFSAVMTCETKPIISDLPRERANDSQLGRLPYCCRNGSLLPTLMDPGQAKSIFQMQVFKLPPNMNRTSLDPPRNWKIEGDLNPNYKCSAPIKVDPTDFPDAAGLPSTTTAIASWQIVCNITQRKSKQSRCCVSFSAYYNDSVVPCNTCACGCDSDSSCSETAKSMLLPAEALLVPFDNRTTKAVAWAKLKNFKVPNPKPCPDNCPVSINWHVNTDYRTGWTARITLFNWDEQAFENWFAAVQMDKAFRGFEGVYSFNGTKLDNLNDTIFLQGLPGLNYLIGETNGSRAGDPRIPGKQQSVISFTKKKTPGINIKRGDVFPNRVFFNGEECALPTRIPTSGGLKSYDVMFLTVMFVVIMTSVLMTDFLHVI